MQLENHKKYAIRTERLRGAGLVYRGKGGVHPRPFTGMAVRKLIAMKSRIEVVGEYEEVMNEIKNGITPEPVDKPQKNTPPEPVDKPHEQGLSDLTPAELRKIAKEKGIKLHDPKYKGRGSKSHIIEAIRSTD